MLERKSYLSNKAVRFFLFASILSSVSNTLAIFTDSVIVGQLLGTEAISAINVAMPIMMVIGTIGVLINLGSAQKMSNALGKGDDYLANQYFTYSVLTNAIVSILFIITGLLFSLKISSFLCSEQAILHLVNDYVKVMLLSSPVYLLFPVLSMFLINSGTPNITAKSVVLVALVNIVLDYVLIKFCDLGIMGSSLATSLGQLSGILLLIGFMLKGKSMLRIVKLTKNIEIQRSIVLGIPIAILSVLFAVKTYGINRIISENFGIEGLEVLSVSSGLFLFILMISAGFVQSTNPMACFMLGQNDYVGFRFIIIKLFKLETIIVGTSTLIAICFPEIILNIFGYKEEIKIIEAGYILRIIVLSFLPLAINNSLLNVYRLTERINFALPLSIIQPLMIVVVLLLFNFTSPNHLWWGFMISEVIVLFATFLTAAYVRQKDKSLFPLLLVPATETKEHLELSLRSDNILDIQDSLSVIEEFLTRKDINPMIVNRVELSTEEIITNILDFAYKDKYRHYIDICISIYENRISVSIKDDGKPFNPITYDTTNSLGLGLGLAKNIVSKLDYKYFSGQNMLFLDFDLN